MQVFERSNSYRISADGGEIIVPKDPANADYQDLLNWIAAGGIVEPEPEPPIVQTPDWLQFRLRMLTNAGYNRMAEAVYSIAPLLQQRLEMAMSFEPPHLPTVQQLWEGWIAICPPTAEEIRQFQAIAQSTQVQLAFGINGAIALT